jgi:hypothetical protein
MAAGSNTHSAVGVQGQEGRDQSRPQASGVYKKMFTWRITIFEGDELQGDRKMHQVQVDIFEPFVIMLNEKCICHETLFCYQGRAVFAQGQGERALLRDTYSTASMLPIVHVVLPGLGRSHVGFPSQPLAHSLEHIKNSNNKDQPMCTVTITGLTARLARTVVASAVEMSISNANGIDDSIWDKTQGLSNGFFLFLGA